LSVLPPPPFKSTTLGDRDLVAIMFMSLRGLLPPAHVAHVVGNRGSNSVGPRGDGDGDDNAASTTPEDDEFDDDAADDDDCGRLAVVQHSDDDEEAAVALAWPSSLALALAAAAAKAGPAAAPPTGMRRPHGTVSGSMGVRGEWQSRD
jgi:hypothetical protein